MSDSRLEKFIYAICSMDVSDLPVPLSRIEKLWNCLITGETPDFEPLSRNEKYLMAMLDRYDISNLPAPMSRGEKLLYKIAVGETDLSDVPGYLSRYEELLKYLIENGGISGGDFEYVLYTLNQSVHTLYTTAEKPVKSAILKGQTLDSYLSIEGNVELNKIYSFTKNFDNNTKYLFIVNVITLNDSGEIIVGELENFSYKNEFKIRNLQLGLNKKVITTNVSCSQIKFVNTSTDLLFNQLMIIPYQEGMENWDIPYFEGMQSVKMPVLTTTGKNLYNKKIHQLYAIMGANKELYYGTDYIPVLSNTTYTKSNNTRYEQYDINKTLLNGANGSTFTTTSDTRYIRYNVLKTEIDTHQLEEGSTATPYEPYKSNILTVSEEVELRGIGDVKDELNLITGELTQKINEIVLDGSESWSNGVATFGDFNRFATNNLQSLRQAYGICDKLPYKATNDEDEHIYVSNSGTVYLFLSNTKASTASELRTYLSSNPITVQYQLKTESIKTVDLTVVDQDNQPTQLGTFENLTHVSLEAEGLIPEVEMEVATNLLEDTVFNLTDAFNTLYPTAEKQVKSAILKGNTLVNLIGEKHEYDTLGAKTLYGWEFMLPYNLASGKTYLAIFDVSGTIDESNSKVYLMDNGFDSRSGNATSTIPTFSLGHNVVKCIATNDIHKVLRIRTVYNENEKFTVSNVMLIEYQDGMENWDIPYFEGMQSVKMPVLTTVGKNLFDIDKAILNQPGTYGYFDLTQYDGDLTFSITDKDTSIDMTGIFFGSTYTGREWDGTTGDNKGGWLITNGWLARRSITTSQCKYFSFYPKTQKVLNRIIMRYNVQIEKSSTATPYEPFKSNILTTSEEVTLRGIGDVKDELNLITGELTQRINEVTIDGSRDEGWSFNGDRGTVVSLISNNITGSKNGTGVLCKDFQTLSDSTISDTELVRMGESSGKIIVQILKEKIGGGLDETAEKWASLFKKWLADNPLTIQYELATESIKTVDLTTVNQDGNETKLRTFDDTTHVLLESEGLIPTASLTVRTKIPSASSTSLLMDDILTNQQQLEATVDEQSENVDATMIATTEIFEETL